MIKKFSDLNSEERKEYFRKKSLDRYHNNKESCALSSKRWRDANKEYCKEAQREKKRERKLKAISYKGGCCERCGGDFHPAVYEFHHIEPSEKEKDPSKLLLYSWEKLTTELDKCVMLCANCHRIQHNEWEFNE